MQVLSRIQNILYVLAMVAVPATAATDFPVAPADVSAAAARGLQRADIVMLRKIFSGTRVEQDSRRKVYRAQYGTDGSVVLSNAAGLIDRGTFSITRQNGGGVCLRLEQQMNQRICAIWFFAEDGAHLFGYNPGDGQLRAVSRSGME